MVSAGTHQASSIKVAEAAKVIENVQRDVNIALVNELSTLFYKLDIDTHAVLEAAKTKWNFLNFQPGLVGGHCIGVDPFYLTHKAAEVGFHPELILAGRRVNDNMPAHVANAVVKLMTKSGIEINSSNILILGLTFKENCPDIRNSKVFDVVKELEEFGCSVDIYDPLVDLGLLTEVVDVNNITTPNQGCYDAVVLAVAHDYFVNLSASELRRFGKETHILFDVKCTASRANRWQAIKIIGDITRFQTAYGIARQMHLGI